MIYLIVPGINPLGMAQVQYLPPEVGDMRAVGADPKCIPLAGPAGEIDIISGPEAPPAGPAPDVAVRNGLQVRCGAGLAAKEVASTDQADSFIIAIALQHLLREAEEFEGDEAVIF